MWNDPIVEETRRLRESYAEEQGHDMDAIFQDILRRQKESSKKLVRLPVRPLAEKLTVTKRRTSPDRCSAIAPHGPVSETF